ncbi:MAG: PAS domain-containing protein, partial [Anaerolineae bacterium]|nr:PAS domain-containing protein [Anaerolineae bacterium]
MMIAISGFKITLFDSFAFYYMLIVVIAGLLLGTKGAVGFSILCLFTLVFTAYIPHRNAMPGHGSRADATLFNYVITFATLAGLLALADRSIQYAINRAYESEAAVKEREMKLRLALSAAHLMDWDWDVNTGEITWGEQLLDLLDTRNITNYETFQQLIHPDDWEVLIQAKDAAIHKGSTWSGEIRIILNQRLHWVAVYSRPVPDDTGRTVRVIGIVQHITERKAMEQQALELMVERKQNKTLTEFIGKLSHDLKNPISVIMVSLELLERIQDPARKQEKIQHIRAQTKRLDHLIQDSLMMNRLEYVTEPTLLPIQLNLMVGGIEERTRPIAERKQIQIVMELEESLPLVKVNEVEFYGALENLLENALNYTPDGGTVTIRTASRSRSIVIE